MKFYEIVVLIFHFSSSITKLICHVLLLLFFSFCFFAFIVFNPDNPSRTYSEELKRQVQQFMQRKSYLLFILQYVRYLVFDLYGNFVLKMDIIPFDVGKVNFSLIFY